MPRISQGHELCAWPQGLDSSCTPSGAVTCDSTGTSFSHLHARSAFLLLTQPAGPQRLFRLYCSPLALSTFPAWERPLQLLETYGRPRCHCGHCVARLLDWLGAKNSIVLSSWLRFFFFFLNSCLAQSCEGMKLYVRRILEAPGNVSSGGMSGLEIKTNYWLAVLRTSLHS